MTGNQLGQTCDKTVCDEKYKHWKDVSKRVFGLLECNPFATTKPSITPGRLSDIDAVKVRKYYNCTGKPFTNIST